MGNEPDKKQLEPLITVATWLKTASLSLIGYIVINGAAQAELTQVPITTLLYNNKDTLWSILFLSFSFGFGIIYLLKVGNRLPDYIPARSSFGYLFRTREGWLLLCQAGSLLTAFVWVQVSKENPLQPHILRYAATAASSPGVTPPPFLSELETKVQKLTDVLEAFDNHIQNGNYGKGVTLLDEIKKEFVDDRKFVKLLDRTDLLLKINSNIGNVDSKLGELRNILHATKVPDYQSKLSEINANLHSVKRAVDDLKLTVAELKPERSTSRER